LNGSKTADSQFKKPVSFSSAHAQRNAFPSPQCAVSNSRLCARCSSRLRRSPNLQPAFADLQPSTRHISAPGPRQFPRNLATCWACLHFAREFAAWGRDGNFVTAFMSFCSTNTLEPCRKCDGAMPDATPSKPFVYIGLTPLRVESSIRLSPSHTQN